MAEDGDAKYQAKSILESLPTIKIYKDRFHLPMFGLTGIDYGIGFDRLDSWSEGAVDHNYIIDSKDYSTKLNFTLGFNIGEL